MKPATAGLQVSSMQSLRADLRGQGAALGIAALIAPDDGGPQNLVTLVQHDRPVHLAGQANRTHTIGAAGVTEDLAYRDNRGAPPVMWILLGPPDVSRGEGLVTGRLRRDDRASLVYENGAAAAGANVDAKKHGGALHGRYGSIQPPCGSNRPFLSSQMNPARCAW